MSDTALVTCPTCDIEVQIPVEEMVVQTYTMDGKGVVTLTSVPPILAAHLTTHPVEG